MGNDCSVMGKNESLHNLANHQSPITRHVPISSLARLKMALNMSSVKRRVCVL
jgi:hypothetical protein